MSFNTLRYLCSNSCISKYLYVQISVYPNICMSKYLHVQISACPNICMSKYLYVQRKNLQISEEPSNRNQNIFNICPSTNQFNKPLPLFWIHRLDSINQISGTPLSTTLCNCWAEKVGIFSKDVLGFRNFA